MTDFHLYAQHWNDQVIAGERYTVRKDILTGEYAYDWWGKDLKAAPAVTDLLGRIRSAIVDSDFVEVGRQGLTYWGRIDSEAGLLVTLCVQAQTLSINVETQVDMNDPEFDEMYTGLKAAAGITFSTFDFNAMKQKLEVLLDTIDPLVVMVEAHDAFVAP